MGAFFEGSEASWKGLESLGGQLEGIGEPWRPLERPGDAQKPGLRGCLEPFARFWGARDGKCNGRHANPVRFGPPKKPILRAQDLRNLYLETEDQTSDHRDLRTVL